MPVPARNSAVERSEFDRPLEAQSLDYWIPLPFHGKQLTGLLAANGKWLDGGPEPAWRVAGRQALARFR